MLPSQSGSPPRMRGQALLGYNLLLVIGITPADAGTRGAFFERSRPSKDHPRGCGDKSSFILSFLLFLGSPPRMRGQAFYEIVVGISGRITPADAGTRLGWLCWFSLCGDHPRGCGDKLTISLVFRPMTGSPPRMRGQVDDLHHSDGGLWITPADAGTSIEGQNTVCTD